MKDAMDTKFLPREIRIFVAVDVVVVLLGVHESIVD